MGAQLVSKRSQPSCQVQSASLDAPSSVIMILVAIVVITLGTYLVRSPVVIWGWRQGGRAINSGDWGRGYEVDM